MNKDFRSLWDPHLNLFVQYDENYRLENNITHAFIQTFLSLNEQEKKEFFQTIFKYDLPEGQLTYKAYLQKKPDENEVSKFHEEKRKLIAISPKGKVWGPENLNTDDEKEAKIEIKKWLEKEAPDFSNDQLKKEADKIWTQIEERKTKGSIPDAWILVYDRNLEPVVLISIENKKWLLNYSQLRNHLEKSLHLEPNKDFIKYLSYSDLTRFFQKKADTNYVVDQFIQYRILLGYEKINDFQAVFNSDQKIRNWLTFDRFAEKILSTAFPNWGKINDRKDSRCYVKRLNINRSYINEINLEFRKDFVNISLCFGSKRNSAKEMLKNIDSALFKAYSPKENEKIDNNFHLHYARGRNINFSYFLWKKIPVADTIEYWKKNYSLLHQLTPTEGIELYKKVVQDRKIGTDNEDFRYFENRLTGKKNKVEPVCEIGFNLKYEYSDIAIRGLDRFASELRDDVDRVFILRKQEKA